MSTLDKLSHHFFFAEGDSIVDQRKVIRREKEYTQNYLEMLEDAEDELDKLEEKLYKEIIREFI
jgi:hypothetical protein